MTGGIAHTAGDLTAGINPLASQLGHLSMQDRAFLDVFNKQEQQELHGGPREGPVDPRGLLGQLEQVKCYLCLYSPNCPVTSTQRDEIGRFIAVWATF